MGGLEEIELRVFILSLSETLEKLLPITSYELG